MMNPNQEREAEDDLPQQNFPNLQLQALMGQMERLLTRALEPIQEKLDKVDARTRNRQPLNVQNRRRGGHVISEDDEDDRNLANILTKPVINKRHQDRFYFRFGWKSPRPVAYIEARTLVYRRRHNQGWKA